jgi:hypothetical protein
MFQKLPVEHKVSSMALIVTTIYKQNKGNHLFIANKTFNETKNILLGHSELKQNKFFLIIHTI